MADCTHCRVQVPRGVTSCPECGLPIGQPTSRKRSLVFFALVATGGCFGLLLIGVIMFAFILNLQEGVQPGGELQEALQKAKQKRTIADIHHVGTAFMRWHGKEAHSGEIRLSENPSAADLTRILVPEYIEEVPLTDGWKYKLEYWVNPDLGARPVFRVRSPGADGAFETYGVLSCASPILRKGEAQPPPPYHDTVRCGLGQPGGWSPGALSPLQLQATAEERQQHARDHSTTTHRRPKSRCSVRVASPSRASSVPGPSICRVCASIAGPTTCSSVVGRNSAR